MNLSISMGSCCFTCTPLHHSLSSPKFPTLNSLSRNGGKKRETTTMELSKKSSKDSSFCKRRALLFVGISVFPLIHLKGNSSQSLAIEETALEMLEQKQEEEPNIFLSFLNGVGILSAGVLGALYALARKENTAIEAMIESMKSQQKEIERKMVSLEKASESKLLNEREKLNKQMKTANEEQQVLISQLNLAKTAITGQGQELKQTHRLVEDLKFQIKNLQTRLEKADENKKELEEKLKEKLHSIEMLQEKVTLLGVEIKGKEENIREIKSTVANKELKLQELNSIFQQTKVELERANLKKANLNQEVLETHEELSEKNAMVNDLNAQVSSLIVERDDLNKKLVGMQKDYNHLKSLSEEKSVEHLKVLEERDMEIHQVKEKIKFTINELSKYEELVSDLTQERDELKKSLDIEMKNFENLKDELKNIEELLGKTRNEAGDMENQLKKSRNTCLDLEGEISKIQTESAKVIESFKISLDEAKHNNEVLTNEMLSMKEVLKNTSNEKRVISDELESVLDNFKSLQNELVGVYKKAEKATNDLEEEKKTNSLLNKELQALEKQISNDKESRKILETGLEETTRSLNDINQNALILSKELENASLHISTLEEEKELIYRALDEQRHVAQEALENMEDAQGLLMKLGEEREGLKKREKRLEEEIATAKGEILRLRSEMNSPRGVVHINDKSVNKVVSEKSTKKVVNGRSRKKVELEEKSDDLATVPVKKSRRKKSETQTDSS